MKIVEITLYVMFILSYTNAAVLIKIFERMYICKSIVKISFKET